VTAHPQAVIVVAGGDPPAGVTLPTGGTVIAVDSGIDHARVLGLHVDLAIGDFDSVSDAGLAWATASGARTERHPVAKDATDLELALDAALELTPSRIVVLGAGGGRLDHLLANLLLLGAARFAAVPIDAYLDGSRLSIVRTVRTLTGKPGDLVTLLPLHGPAHGVTTTGLAYGLDDATLDCGSTRGVSNVLTEPEAHIAVRSGVLLAIQPEDAR
jgi:thiamine pyrophosphokinase